ncbi:RNA-directed DNA polymerase, eukaryota, reverse transcriptase zinc-binding domain protein [Tanacetum coccineum]
MEVNSSRCSENLWSAPSMICSLWFGITFAKPNASSTRTTESWALDEDGEFKVKMLTSLIEKKILQGDSGGHDTLWNKLVPKKVNIFVWRARKCRLPVRVELDRRGIDLDSVLCASCNDSVESCAHCLVTCDLCGQKISIGRRWGVLIFLLLMIFYRIVEMLVFLPL